MEWEHENVESMAFFDKILLKQNLVKKFMIYPWVQIKKELGIRQWSGRRTDLYLLEKCRPSNQEFQPLTRTHLAEWESKECSCCSVE